MMVIGNGMPISGTDRLRLKSEKVKLFLGNLGQTGLNSLTKTPL
jgi:hypothetical protein